MTDLREPPVATAAPRRPWTVAVAAGLAVVLIGAIGLVIAHAFDGGDRSTPQVQSPTSAPTDDDAGEGGPDGDASRESRPGTEETDQPTSAADGVYEPVPDLCSKLDLSAYAEMTEVREPRTVSTDTDTTCYWGLTTIEARWHASHDDAIAGYEHAVEVFTEAEENVEEVAGPWDAATLATSEQFSDSSADAIVIAVAATMTVIMDLGIVGAPAPIDQDAAVEAVLATVAEIFTISDTAVPAPQPEPDEGHTPDSTDTDPVYDYSPDLCQRLDYGLFEELTELGNIEGASYDAIQETSCTASPIKGNFFIDAAWSESESDALRLYDIDVENFLISSGSVEQVPGPWDAAALGQNPSSIENSCDATLVTIDGTMVVRVRFWIIGGDRPVDQRDVVDAVIDLASQAYEHSAAA